MTQIANGQNANGASVGSHDHYGSEFATVFVSGTLDGGQLAVEARLPDGSGWVPVSGDPIIEEGAYSVYIGAATLRVNASGMTSGNFSAWLISGDDRSALG